MRHDSFPKPWEHLDVSQFFEHQFPHHIFHYITEVTEGDLDFFGHVNNANYLKIYENARWAFINKNHYGLEKIQKERQGPVLLEVHLKFRRELKIGHKILVLSQCQKVDHRFLTLRQVMVRDDMFLASEAIFLIGYFDLDSRKLITPNLDWLNAVGFKNQ